MTLDTSESEERRVVLNEKNFKTSFIKILGLFPQSCNIAYLADIYPGEENTEISARSGCGQL
jgi:hypothetical protein